MTALAAMSVAVLAPSLANATASSPPIPRCAFGTDTPRLRGFLPAAIDRAANDYAAHLNGDSAATRARARQIFAAAAAAYVYGLPQVTERATIKHFPRNEIVSVAALATPAVQTVVSPNVDTAYTVAWLDLLNGPIVINVPNTNGRFYTFQFMDAFTDDFAYVGSGSTGTKSGAYVLVPPGWSGTLPPGLRRINAPSNTVWLLGRTLVRSAADLPAVKRLQEQYEATPLTAWSAGTRQPPLVLDQYPPTIPKSIPTGAQFIGTLNNEMEIDPPPASQDCALRAMAPAGVQVPHPTPAQSQLADLSDVPPAPPAIAGDPVANAAINAGTAQGAEIISNGASQLNASSRRVDDGWEILGSWVGRYGQNYIGRAIVALNLLGANTPQQSIYPLADTDVTGRTLNGSSRYTIRFPKGKFPPVRAFWSLTLYNASYFLYANQADRYAVGDRTTGLRRGRDGSLTIYVQHNRPAGAAQRANWLPAPAGVFHLTLRLYMPREAALDGAWKPPPIRRVGPIAKPKITRLRIAPTSFRPARTGTIVSAHGPARVSYRDTLETGSSFAIVALEPRRGCKPTRRRSCVRAVVVARFHHADRAGSNRFRLSGRVRGHPLRPGRYLLRAFAGGSGGVPRSAAVSVGFRII